jgi:hypothetical protein
MTTSPTTTLTSTSTSTPLPSKTPTATPTTSNGEIVGFSLPELNIYQRPGGPIIGNLFPGQKVTILYGKEVLNGLVWIEIQDAYGRIGWTLEVFMRLILPTPTKSSTPTLITNTPTLMPSLITLMITPRP